MDFKPFTDIKRLDSISMFITQKLHGTNASVWISEVLEATGFQPDAPFHTVEGKQYILKVGSRNRWITPEADNYGFAAFVHANKEEFIQKLGVGTHFGEWVGPGINSSEGLTERTFVLFDFWKFPEDRPLPPKTKIVPVLYHGKLDSSKIEETMNDIKTNGSKLVAGFMNVEGVVVTIGGTRFKKVFQAEETKWTGVKKVKAPKAATPDFSHLLQPIRLEKLLSRDEAYTLGYPSSLPLIVMAYVQDLIKEDQITMEEADLNKKHLANAIYPFVKELVKV